MQNNLSTEELARAFLVKPETVRSSYCREGHYFGLRPTKLPNGRLLWPADAMTRVTGKEGK